MLFDFSYKGKIMQESNLMEMTLNEIDALKEGVCYVDIRSKIAYEHGHIPNALHLSSLSEESLQILPKDKLLIVYCSVGEKSRNVVKTLIEAGIIGAVAGVIGCIQALEAIKYILNVGELLTGKMLIFDGLKMKFRIADFEKKSSSCRVCGGQKDIFDVAKNASEYERRACDLDF